MPAAKPTRQKLTLSNLATARPGETPESEQTALASTNTVAPDAQQPVSPKDAPTVPRFGDKKPRHFDIKDF